GDGGVWRGGEGGELGDVALVEAVGGLGVPGLDRDAVVARRDVDRLVCRADAQLRVRAQSLRDRKLRGDLARREAVRRDANLVFARRQAGERIFTLVVGCGCARLAGSARCERNGRVCKPRPRLICHCAVDRAGERLSINRAAARCRQYNDDERAKQRAETTYKFLLLPAKDNWFHFYLPELLGLNIKLRPESPEPHCAF